MSEGRVTSTDTGGLIWLFVMQKKQANSHTLVKFCGITRTADAATALRVGANALGLVFFAGSPRFVTSEQAAEICRVIDGNETNNRVLKVGLFVDAAAEDVLQVLEQVPLDILQFHGNEPAAYCDQFHLPYWKALRVRNAGDIENFIPAYTSAAALLLDAWHPDQHGGTGLAFDWDLLAGINPDQNIVLAGGLTPENVAQAIRQVAPWGVDVSSGIEEAPGIKSESLMKQFIEEVRSV